MSRPDFRLFGVLEKHRASLQDRAKRLDRLINTVDHTIANIKGKPGMTVQEYFEGFDETRHEDETRERWGNTTQYAETQRKWASNSKEQKEAIKAEGSRLALRMVSEDPDALPDDPDVQAAVGEYYAYINKYFYSCEVSFLRGLVDGWVSDPRFAINYERIREGIAGFVRQAVNIYCDQNG